MIPHAGRLPARPGFHFTVPEGHLNDPLGVTWHDGRYELFYQFNPEGPVWVPACRWGQADGADLVRWQRPRTALEPGSAQQGCWSGAVAVAPGGQPTILFTSVDTAAPELGRIALASGDAEWSRWTLDAHGPVLPGPPPELDLHHFRDPFVWASGPGWRMLVGGGTRDGHGVAVQYVSSDLRRWRYDGVLAERPASAADPMPTGTVWECPQLFPIGGSWVLLVSAWDGEPGSVAAAVGDYDGRRFTARSWQRLDVTGELYATTAFTDAAGRRCVLSWLPRTGPAEGPWAGMLSLPHLLDLDSDRLLVRPHPDVDLLRTAMVASTGDRLLDGEVAVGPVDSLLDVDLAAAVPHGSRLELAVREDGAGSPELTVVLDAAGVDVRRPGQEPQRFPGGPAAGGRVRLLLDVGVAELFTDPGGVAVLRLAGASGRPVQLAVTGVGPGVRLTRLDVHGMARWFDG